MNLPNSLSVTRIFLVPLLVVVLLTKFEGRMVLGVRKELVAAAIFGIASLTDFLDGGEQQRDHERAHWDQHEEWKDGPEGDAPPPRRFDRHRRALGAG